MEVCIFSTVNQMEADMLKNALDEKNIANYLKNASANSLGLGGWTTPFAGTNLGYGNIKVMVKEEDVQEALKIVIALFGNEEGNDDNTGEETEIPSTDPENLNEPQQSPEPEKTIKDDTDNNTKTQRKKKSPRRNFLIFFGSIFFVSMVFIVIGTAIDKQSRPPRNATTAAPQQQAQQQAGTVPRYHAGLAPQQRVETLPQQLTGGDTQYYFEQFIIPKPEYRLVNLPSRWDFDSTRYYREQLKAHNDKLLYSIAAATLNGFLPFFNDSGYTPIETGNIVYELNVLGNMLIFGEYREDRNYMLITYFEKL